MKRAAVISISFLVLALAISGLVLALRSWTGFPFVERGGHLALDLPVIEKHWVPDPAKPGCGTLYILAQGDESDLKRHAADFPIRTPPVSDPSFRHTSCPMPWWTPPTSPGLQLGRATLEEPRLPDARHEYEFVITAGKGGVYYEQRTLPLRP